jgi:hypothetical protein
MIHAKNRARDSPSYLKIGYGFHEIMSIYTSCMDAIILGIGVIGQ